MNDRRNFYRWGCSLPCRLETGSRRLEGRVCDLSFNGARIESNDPTPPVECRLIVHLEHDHRAIRLSGKVIYSRDGCFGIVFEDERLQRTRLLMPYFQESIQEQTKDLADAV